MTRLAEVVARAAPTLILLVAAGYSTALWRLPDVAHAAVDEVPDQYERRLLEHLARRAPERLADE